MGAETEMAAAAVARAVAASSLTKVVSHYGFNHCN